MKNLLFTLMVLCLFTFTSIAQDQGEIRLSAGIAFGSKAGFDEGGEKMGAGLNIGGEYFITNIISVAPSYTFFFKSSIEYFDEEYKSRYSSLNIDGRYYFLTDGVHVYGLLGLSFASFKSEYPNPITGEKADISDNKTGLNIGGGANYLIADNIGLNGQIHYNTPIEQLVISVGAFYILNY